MLSLNSILNSFLKIMNLSFMKIMMTLTQTSWNTVYYSKRF